MDIIFNSLIPPRFQTTFDLKTKARGFVSSQLIVGGILTLIGLFFGFVEYDVVEFYLNTAIGVYLISTVLTIRFFRFFESYVNLVMSGAYTVAFLFIIFSGGIFADETFWLALLISININYGRRRHVVFWSVIITVFLGGLYYAQTYGGLYLPPDKITPAERITTLFSFFMLLWVITLGSSRVNRKKIENQMKVISDHKRLLKEREDLMSIIAHDMKSPSRRIEGLISIFDQSNLTGDQKEILERLKGTVNENKQLIDDLIEATSFQATLSLELVEINHLMDELVTGFLPIADKKDIFLDFKRRRGKMLVETSSYQLRRILDNLISNALKFSYPGTKVVITCSQNETETNISVEDHGPGFTEEDLPKMFKMFQKLSAKPTGGEVSSGLGLSIVKNLTGLLNGKIEYETKPGKGSVFTLILPNTFKQGDQNNTPE